jgi:DNA-binding response OmpR family regulator
MTATNGIDALKILTSKENVIDMVILDLMLPGIDGWEVCYRLRQHSSLPVIILTAKVELPDKLHGFSLGADDYIVKPFDPLELVARVKAVLHRAKDKSQRVGDKPQRVELPELIIDLTSYTVKAAGETIEFTSKEIEFLYFLASHPNRVFSREFLLQQLWGFDFLGNTRTVDVYVNRLRKKLERFSKAWHIKTVWDVGYKFVLEEKDA